MNAVDKLIQEHDEIMAMLKVVEKICSVMEAGGEVEHGHLQRVVEYIRIYINSYHRKREETLLFSEMKKSSGGRYDSLIERVLEEHVNSRECEDKMREAWKRTKKGEHLAIGDFTRSTRQFLENIITHIDDENTKIFPLVRVLFSEKKHMEIKEALEKRSGQDLVIRIDGEDETPYNMRTYLMDIYL